jgi:hypothetical protein
VTIEDIDEQRRKLFVLGICQPLASANFRKIMIGAAFFVCKLDH